MSDLTKTIGIDVLEAANQRIAWTFDTFPRVMLSFSAGKDSTVMMHLACQEARLRGRKVDVMLVDLEAQYQATMDHAEAMFEQYSDVARPWWLALPLRLRNAVSNYEPRWMCWDADQRLRWVRTAPRFAITETNHELPFFRPGMEFEELVPAFSEWLSGGQPLGVLVGIRTDESLNRWRSIVKLGRKLHGKPYCNYMDGSVFNIYPIYDWKTQDIWAYHGKTGEPYNDIYDLMYKAGLGIHQQRICQPYGDDQRKGLWLFHLLEPETWGKVVARVSGVNSGALYSQESGNINGTIKISKPDGITWQEFAERLLTSLPAKTAEHYRNKFAVFLRWHQERGFEDGIPDLADPAEENAKRAPSWRRICKVLLRNDWHCKGLSFTETKSDSYERYLKRMRARRMEWNLF